MLTLTNVTKRYGNRAVLDHIKLTINEGEFVGLVGTNGVGKTTLIKSILNLVDFQSGQVTIGGHDHKTQAARATLTYLPERFMPPSHFSGRDYLRYYLALHAIPYNTDSTHTCLSRLDFDTTALTQSVRTYSKGMVQKLGLAACFLSGKNLSILDEPMSGLDPRARMYLKRYLADLKDAGQTMLISTHMLADVASICDRMVLLHDGHFLYEGTPKAFVEKYGAEDYDEAFMSCVQSNACEQD